MADNAQPAGSDLVSLAEIREAASLLASVALRTPLVAVPMLSSGLLVKPESLQPTGSFKLRGAYTAISMSGLQAKERGVIAIRAAITVKQWPTRLPCWECARWWWYRGRPPKSRPTRSSTTA